MPEAGPLLGIDYGKRCTGLAIAHPLTGSARPLPPVQAHSDQSLLPQVMAVVKAWRPSQIVLGLPLSGSGDETDLSRAVRRFGEALAQHLADSAMDVALAYQDERLTSVAAAERHAQRRQQGRARQRDARQLDSVAASLILEAWMQERP